MRKLVTIARVVKVENIPGADAIDVATVRGWMVVVKKGDFNAGDLGVFMEVDSFLPANDERYKFLVKTNYKEMADGSKGIRLKSIKMRGQISQGLLMPLSQFPEIADPKEDDDVTELLNVKLYEAPIPAHLGGESRGNFPIYFRKTGEERIQNMLKFIDTYKDVEFIVTTKINGSSFSASYCNNESYKDDFNVCSHNICLLETEANSFWSMARRYELPARLKAYGRNIAVQAELFGEGIQKNREQIRGQDILVFNIYDIDKRRYFKYDEQQDILRGLNYERSPETTLKYVPVIYRGRLFQEYPTLDGLLAFAGNGKSYRASVREGVVCKSADYVNGEIISFKILNNSYLLKYEE
jgi:RNA ligase (TIGR02306 family)